MYKFLFRFFFYLTLEEINMYDTLTERLLL